MVVLPIKIYVFLGLLYMYKWKKAFQPLIINDNTMSIFILSFSTVYGE